jgi:pimeloyl-ACP methyl ester carboxylesterase
VGDGSRSGEPLLLIAGLGQGTWIWDEVAPVLARDRPVSAFEARGTGTRTGLAPRRSIGEMAADVAAELEQPAHVLGFSMGGHVALTLATTRPGFVQSLLLIGTGGGGPGRARRPRDVADAMTEALGLDDYEFAYRTMPFTFAPGWVEANPARFEQIMQGRLANPTPYELLDAHATACTDFYEAGCPLESIEIDALVVHGAEDLIVPVENGRALAERLPRAEYVELPGYGHNLMLEDPALFVRLVDGFLR